MSKDANQNEAKLGKELNFKKDFPYPSYEDWKKTAEGDLKGVPFEKKLITKTYESIDLQPIYLKKDIEELPILDEYSGAGDYTRGGKASGYLKNSWEIAQEIFESNPEDFNAALKSDIQRGQTAVNIVFDKFTRGGSEIKSDLISGAGLSVLSGKCFAKALDGVDLNKYFLFMDCGYTPLIGLALLDNFAKEANIDFKNIKGGALADPIKYLIEEGVLPVDESSAFDEFKMALDWLKSKKSDLKFIGIDGSIYSNAGASAAHELAFSLASAVEYINALIDRGVSIDEISARVRFTFGVGSFYFMEIAKLRAARVLWSKIIGEYGGSEDSRKMYIHAKTLSYNQTKYDPYVNLLRTTTESFSAVVGGVDSLHSSPFDELANGSNDFSRRIARNIQIILKEEAQLASIIDAAGGSYFVEKLTSEICAKAWELFREIQKKGGALKSIKEGFIQNEIEKTALQKKEDAAKRKNVIVGVNMYANIKEEPLKVDDSKVKAFYAKRAEQLTKLKSRRNDKKLAELSDKIHSLYSQKSCDVLNVCSEAFSAGSSAVEAFSAIRRGAKGIEIKNPLKPRRLAEDFEELRAIAGNYKEKRGRRPQVFLITMGPVKQHKARADFSTGFFEAGGFEVIYKKGFDSVNEAVEEAAKSSADVVVICSTDETYPELVPAIVPQMKKRNKDAVIILAGYPKDQIEAHKKSGVDDFIYLGANVYEILKRILSAIK